MDKSDERNLEHSGFGTRAIHAGQEPDELTGAVMVPIYTTSTFKQPTPGQFYPKGSDYGRVDNPTRHALEDCIADLEYCKYGVAFASGCAATQMLISMLKLGDHIACIDDVYGGTQRLFRQLAGPNQGIEFDFVDMTQEGALDKVLNEKTKFVWVESPTNPTLKVADIRKMAEKAHSVGAKLVVDNTFMSPYLQSPVKLGADIVLHSATKYIGGHSDLIMGLITTNDEEVFTQLKWLQKSIGAIPGPFDCYLALRGLKTLHIRMKEHVHHAEKIATFLEGHDRVDKVLWPGLPSHPQHELAKSQTRGPGGSGVITVYIKGGVEESKKFLETLKIFTLAESLGGVESLAEHPALMTHGSVPAEHRQTLGIFDNLVRISVGIEDCDDLIKDLDDALQASATVKSA